MPSAPLLPEVPDEATFTRLRGDPQIWLPAIRTICARHGLDADQAFAERTGSNVLFQVAGGPWIKLFLPLWPGDHLRERAGLRAATGIADLAVPHVLHEGELEGWQYLVLSHVEGRAIGTVWPDLDPSTRVELAQQAGALFRRLHDRAEPAAFAPIQEDWPSYARALRADAVMRQTGYGLDPAWAGALAEFVAALPPMDTGSEVVLHADVTDEHLFLDKRDGRWAITGLIDFGDAMVGDLAYEFAAPLVFLCQRQPRVQRALLEGYGFTPNELTPAFGQRLVAWALLHRWGRIASYARFTPGPPPQSLADLVEAIWTPT